MEQKWFTTEHPKIVFENTSVGRLKKEIFEASEEEIDKILAEYEVPSPSELGKGGCYIQTTPRSKTIEKRRKNDVVLIPVGCTENHGAHANSGLDTFMATQTCEGWLTSMLSLARNGRANSKASKMTIAIRAASRGRFSSRFHRRRCRRDSCRKRKVPSFAG